MSDAVAHPVVTSTTVTEEVKDFAEMVRHFYDRNHVVINVGVALFISAFVNRSLMRRELTRLHFAVEVFDGEVGEHFFDED